MIVHEAPFSKTPQCDHLTCIQTPLVPLNIFVVHSSLTENLAGLIDVSAASAKTSEVYKATTLQQKTWTLQSTAHAGAEL